MAPKAPRVPGEPPPPSREAGRPEGQTTDRGDLIIAGGNVFITIYRSFFATTTQRVLTLLFLTIAIALGMTIYWVTRQPWPLRGRFNIAVAEFRQVQDGQARVTDTSAWIGRKLAGFLETELADLGLEVEVGHRNMPYVQDARRAARLADQVRAHLVIYGTFDQVGSQISLKPQFYLVSEVETARRRKAGIEPDVDEIKRSHPFGLTLTLEPGSPELFEEELKARAAALSYFAQGLIHLHGDDPRPALAAFENAAQAAAALPSFEGLEALYLFTAVANRRLGDYEAALAALDRAFEANPDYGRAIVARANIYYSQAADGFSAMDGCLAPGLDEATGELCREGRNEEAWWNLLARAEATYRQAAEAGRQEYSFYLAEKGWLGVGNVRLLAAQQGEDLFGAYEQALAAYQQVADSYVQTPDEAKRDLAASAYWGLGVTHERMGHDRDAEASYQRCARVVQYDRVLKDRCESMLAELKARRAGP